MSLPGWENLESARTTHAAFEFAGLSFFAALVLFEILDHREKRQTNRKKLFKGLALISFAVAVICEIIAFPYSRRVDKLSERKESQLELRINEDSNLLAQARETAKNASNIVNNANIAVLQNLGRHLSHDQQLLLLSKIDPLPKEKITFFVDNTLPDALGLSEEILQVFMSAKWQQEKSHRGISFELKEGVSVRGSDGATIKAIADALTDVGLHGIAETNEPSRDGSSNLIGITVGFKPRK